MRNEKIMTVPLYLACIILLALVLISLRTDNTMLAAILSGVVGLIMFNVRFIERHNSNVIN